MCIAQSNGVNCFVEPLWIYLATVCYGTLKASTNPWYWFCVIRLCMTDFPFTFLSDLLHLTEQNSFSITILILMKFSITHNVSLPNFNLNRGVISRVTENTLCGFAELFNAVILTRRIPSKSQCVYWKTSDKMPSNCLKMVPGVCLNPILHTNAAE